MKPAALVGALCALLSISIASAAAEKDKSGGGVSAETSQSVFAAWAKQRAVELQTFPADSAIDERVASLVGSARVVSVGEPAHGAHEPLEFRNRLFRYLVEKQRFTAIALESGFNEARLVNAFVLGEAGDPRQIALAGLTWGFGGFAENVELLRWMRAYNADQAPDRKVRFYGIDLTGGDNAGGFVGSAVAIKDALSYLGRTDGEWSSRALADLERFLDRFTLEQYKSLSASERSDFQTAIDAVMARFTSERPRLIKASSEREYQWALRSIVVAKQLETLFRLSPTDVPTEGVVAGFHAAAAARDAAMADNALWALRREGPAGRVLVFAHNAHIMNAPLRGGIWSVYPEPPAVMGQHLRSALGKELLIIGTSSAANGRGLPAAPAKATSVDTVLARVGVSHFLLDLREAPRVTFPWLKKTQSMRANFTTEIEVSLADAFDAVVYFEELSASRTE